MEIYHLNEYGSYQEIGLSKIFAQKCPY